MDDSGDERLDSEEEEEEEGDDGKMTGEREVRSSCIEEGEEEVRFDV